MKNASLSIREADSAIVPMTEQEQEIATFLEELDELLGTPFIQPTAIATNGARFTILRTAQRLGKKLQTNEEVLQLIYLARLQDPVQYTTKMNEKKEFSDDSLVLIALEANNVREQVHAKIEQALASSPEGLPNMTLRFVRPSKARQAQGLSPSIALCHSSAWKAL